MSYRSGRHFLQIPGPTNVPDRILRAIDMPTMDHRGPEFGKMGLEILAGLREVFHTRQPVVIYPASGTGAWEAALVNTLEHWPESKWGWCWPLYRIRRAACRRRWITWLTAPAARRNRVRSPETYQ